MREEKKLKNALKKCGEQTQSDILYELQNRYPQYSSVKAPKHNNSRKTKYITFSAVAACAACIAIAVPCAVLLPNNESNPNGGNDWQYFTQGDYSLIYPDYTIREYNEMNDCNILYFDWYDIAEEVSTCSYNSIATNEVLCLQEEFFLAETEEMITLSVTKSNVYLNLFDIKLEKCKENEQIVDNVIINWSAGRDESFCIFVTDDYRYIISLETGNNENRLFELVKELIE